MTYEQYWNGDVQMAETFLEADRLRQQRQNNEAWLQGMYFYDGLCCALSSAFGKKGHKARSYPAKPYALADEKQEQKETQDEKERLRAEVYMRQMVRAGRSWGKKA